MPKGGTSQSPKFGIYRPKLTLQLCHMLRAEPHTEPQFSHLKSEKGIYTRDLRRLAKDG